MSETTLIIALAQMMANARDKGVPLEVRKSVRQRILDILGICVAASSLPTSDAIRRLARNQGGAREATAIGVEGRLPASLAALVNGTLAHSLDYDDTHLPSVLHPSASVIPACLSAAELVHAPGADAVVAIAVGLEACVRLGMAGYDEKNRDSRYFARGQHATSSCGTIASAGAVACLLGLDADGIAHAMSVAVSMASGVIEANRTGGTVKRIHCGWSAHSAISAARMAQLGITGPPTVLEGRFGFFRAYLDDQYSGSAITDGLGSEWSVPGINFKPYPANHFTHAGIDAALALRSRGLRAVEVKALQLGVSLPVLHTVGEPIDTKRMPQTGYQAQFSGPYTVVAALIGGHGLGLGLDDFTDELAHEPSRRALMAKVSVVEDAECSALFPKQFAAVLSAMTTDGRELTERVSTNRGGPERPLSDEELMRKFADNTKRVLDEDDMSQLQEGVWSLDTADSVTACLKPLARAFSPDPRC